MSEQDNVKTVQQAYEAFKKGDIQTILGTLTDDIEWATPKVVGMPFGGTTKGKEAVLDFFRKMSESEDILQFEPKEFIAQGDRVAVTGDLRCKVKATGREAASPWVHVFNFKGGKVARFFEIYDTAAAERAYQKAKSA